MRHLPQVLRLPFMNLSASIKMSAIYSLPIFCLILATTASAQQSATPTLQKAVTPKYAGTFSPLTGFAPESKQHRVGTAIVYNNTLMANYYMTVPGAGHELIDNFIVTDTDGTGAEAVNGMEYTYCSSVSNPNGIFETITVYDESVYCAGPTNWPVFDCGYGIAGLPGGNNGWLACWIVTLDLTGVECNLTDGHGGHAGWGQTWDNSNTGPWLAGGGLGQTPTYTWFDHSQPNANAFQGCQFITGTSATGFAMEMFAEPTGNPPVLTATGSPGGAMTFDVTGCTPVSPVAMMRAFGRGSHQAFNPITGNYVTTGLTWAGFTIQNIGLANLAGQYSYTANVPGPAAGLISTQAIDAATDCLSNVIDL